MKRSSIFVGVTLLLLTLAATAAPAATITVQLIVVDFVAQDITIEVGDTVRWEWVSGFHNVESGVVVSGLGVPDGRFRSGDPTGVVGNIFELVFDQAFLDANPIAGNVYPYYCIVHTHDDMVGTITVSACTTNADCADTDLCNGAEICQNGTCVSGTALNCDDGNVCTDDSCVAATGCQHVNDDTNTCDDGEACTSNDVCSAGTCAGTPGPDCCQIDSDCDDGNDCTDDQCGGGVCTTVANTAACDDGNMCTDGDVCSQEVCSGTAVSGCCNSDADCDDGDAGTLDTCEASICIISVIDPCLADSDCNDGDVCTTDSCDAGLCNAAAIDGCCNADADCDDADECTDDVCVDNVCDNTPIDGCSASTGGTPSLCGAAGMIVFTFMFMGLMAMRVAPGFSWRRNDRR